MGGGGEKNDCEKGMKRMGCDMGEGFSALHTALNQSEKTPRLVDL